MSYKSLPINLFDLELDSEEITATTTELVIERTVKVLTNDQPNDQAGDPPSSKELIAHIVQSVTDKVLKVANNVTAVTNVTDAEIPVVMESRPDHPDHLPIGEVMYMIRTNEGNVNPEGVMSSDEFLHLATNFATNGYTDMVSTNDTGLVGTNVPDLDLSEKVAMELGALDLGDLGESLTADMRSVTFVNYYKPLTVVILVGKKNN